MRQLCGLIKDLWESHMIYKFKQLKYIRTKRLEQRIKQKFNLDFPNIGTCDFCIVFSQGKCKSYFQHYLTLMTKIMNH